MQEGTSFAVRACVLMCVRVCACVMPNQVSISPTFYLQLLCTKVICSAFLYLQFGFVIFWQKNISEKSISPIFYEELFRLKIPKVQTDSDGSTVFSHFWDLRA